MEYFYFVYVNFCHFNQDYLLLNIGFLCFSFHPPRWSVLKVALLLANGIIMVMWHLW